AIGTPFGDDEAFLVQRFAQALFHLAGAIAVGRFEPGDAQHAGPFDQASLFGLWYRTVGVPRKAPGAETQFTHAQFGLAECPLAHAPPIADYATSVGRLSPARTRSAWSVST